MTNSYLWVGTNFPQQFLDAFRALPPQGPEVECWPWPGSVSAQGYGLFRHAGMVSTTHRISFAAYHEDPPAGLVVRHRCDNRPCWNPSCLLIGTQGDNMNDAATRKRMPHSDAAAKKLTSIDARQLFEAYHRGRSTASLAREYSLSTATVHFIANRKMWTRATADLASPEFCKDDRMLRGTAHPRARATPEMAEQIRSRVANGEPRRRMVEDYGISASVVQRIVKGESWLPHQRRGD